jgi:hypothetical protein
MGFFSNVVATGRAVVILLILLSPFIVFTFLQFTTPFSGNGRAGSDDNREEKTEGKHFKIRLPAPAAIIPVNRFFLSMVLSRIRRNAEIKAKVFIPRETVKK